MVTRGGRALAATIVALSHIGVLVAPPLVLAATAHKGAVTGRDGRVLFVASLLVGLASGMVAGRHVLRRRRRDARALALASLDALVVLALVSTGLLFVALGAYEPAAPLLVNRGWPVVVTWVLAQGTAVALAELTRAGVERWLAREPVGPSAGPDPP